VWSAPDADGDEQKLQSGHYFVDIARRPLALATAGP